MKIRSPLLAALITIIAAVLCPAQAQPSSSGNTQPTENASEITYHFTVMMPQYRFLDTGGNPSRVGEYDSLQQSLGGDLFLNFADVPDHLTIKSAVSVITRDDYEAKSRLTLGKWLDFTLENRGFIRHLDDTFYFGAKVISDDIYRIDTISPDSLLGVRRRMNNFRVRARLPKIPVKLFVKGGWQARDGTGQLQYFDMGGDGTLTDTGCDNCHSGSQYRTYNYTTRNIAGGAEVTLGRLLKLTYQHEFRSFNDRMQNPVGTYGSAIPNPPDEDIPYTPAGYYVNNVLPRHQTQADSLQVSMAVAHHVTFNSDVSYARTTNLFASHKQNAFNADATLTWNPVHRLRAVVDFHQQNLLNDWVQMYSLSDPTKFYPYGNPSLHRHWAGVRLAYRLSKQFDVETYYKRMNITRSDAALWPQHSSPHNTDPFLVPANFNLVPASFSNIAGLALHFHTGEFWDARTGYEWTGTHAPGYVTDPRTNHRLFGDVTFTPVRWLSLSDDASIMLQQSFPGVFPVTGLPLQRSNHFYTNTSFVTLRPVPEWRIGAGYTYLQNNLRTDMQFGNDSAVALYTQPLVPYKDLSQTYSVTSTYELKKRLGLNVNFAHSAAHSSMRPDLNPAHYPVFPWTQVDPNFPVEFAGALGLAAGRISQVNVPQTLIGSTANYHFRSGFDGGLRFQYGSYKDYVRPDLNGKLRSYSVFVGRGW